MSKESFPIKTRLAAGFMVLAAGTAALTGCSSHSGDTPKPSHAAKISETSPTPPRSSSSTKPKPATSSPKPTVSPSGKLTATDIENINFCNFPALIDAVKKSGDSNIACDFESAYGAAVSGDSVYLYDKDVKLTVVPTPNYIAYIKVHENSAYSNEFSGGQSPEFTSVVDGKSCDWSSSQFGNYNSGLECLLGDSNDPSAPVVGVYISSRGAQASYELHQQLMEATLGSISTEGNLDLSSINKSPSCIQQQSC